MLLLSPGSAADDETLASAVTDGPEARSITLAAVVELMHLATLVHDDSVDHSVLRRGLPTVNSLFSHQVSVIMGDFLYTRAHRALVEVGDLEFLRILTTVANELTIGEMRQLGALDAAFEELTDRLGVEEPTGWVAEHPVVLCVG